MRSAPLIILAASIAAFALGACGEKPTVTVYKQGSYQGKPDNLPWQGDRFSGNKTEWEKTIKARNIGQNEYVRIEGQ
jgi:hypothetical protein